jgi:hypothetical protein
MSKIIGVTVGTPISAAKIDEEIKPVKTVNNKAPDDNGNVNIEAGGIDTDDLQDAIEDALAEAKASGEFDGADGKDGTNGKDGANGKDGVSATHSWNGTVLTITSASGTSSANLKGDKGNTGDSGLSVHFISGEEADVDPDGNYEISIGTYSLQTGVRVFELILLDDGYIYRVKSFNSATVVICDRLFSIKGDRGPVGPTGATGATGANGKDGRGILSIERTKGNGAAGTTDTYTITFTDNTTKLITVYNGANGTNGKDGTSVTVSKVTESSASGGTNVVTFSDGNTLNVKNGKDGVGGERGPGILSTTTGIASYTTTVNGVKPTYRILLSTLKTQAGVDKVLIGDHIRYSTYLYLIITLDSEYAYMGARISLQGSAGASSEWYTGTGITGTSTTATIFSGSGISAATVGDMYLNTSTYNTYRCTTAGAASAAKWVYVCNIKGEKGDSYTLNDTDKNTIVNAVKAALPTLTMTGKDADGVEHTWTIYGS